MVFGVRKTELLEGWFCDDSITSLTGACCSGNTFLCDFVSEEDAIGDCLRVVNL